MNIGNKIKELRKQRGVTQEQLAESMGISFQAVSKWENNIAFPDITLLPVLARYFDVSMDTLFDFNQSEIEEKSLEIAKESWKYRFSDNEKAREILEKGLKEYPDNDILLCNLLYVVDLDSNPDEVLKIGSKILDVTKDDGLKYDACRFMAYAYKSKNDLDSARKVIDIIPEIYISHLSVKAEVMEGEEKWRAACTEEGVCLQNMLDMHSIMVDCYKEKGEFQNALNQCEKSLKILDVLECSSNWDSVRISFKEKADEMKAKIK
ncbi:MAG: helix-turn-helix transcriptional regulator [Clostridia bacterium]|nr:helix-turn-helix transcriptional regulator [Clostridia bacterium]